MFGVPSWVIILFFVLLYMGIKRCQTRVVSVKRLLIVPIVFTYMSLRGASQLFHFSVLSLVLLIAGALIGFGVGHWQVRNTEVKADKDRYLVQIPGSMSMLIMLMLVFLIEFFIHFSIDAHIGIAATAIFKWVAIVLSGIVVGISIGRNATYLFKYQNTPTCELADIKSS